jgi:putative FmdB family regulatory protein
MPIYEYQCQACENIVEAWQSLSDEPLSVCPECAGPMKKLISSSSFQLKGGGWYADGYGSGSGKSCKAASSAPAPATATKTETPAACPKKDKSSCGCC